MFQMVKDFFNGLWNENPTFKMIIGMCPTLAVTTAASNGIAMGLATTFVLLFSSALISLLRNFIPAKVRIPCYIIVIATFVTVVDLFMAGYFPAMYKILGLYIPLIVVNCIIMARAEAFASKVSLGRSIADAVGMGLGFTWAITLIGAVREIMGSGSVFGYHILGQNATHWVIMLLPPGAFLTMGILLGIMNTLTRKTVKDTHCH